MHHPDRKEEKRYCLIGVAAQKEHHGEHDQSGQLHQYPALFGTQLQTLGALTAAESAAVGRGAEEASDQHQRRIGKANDQ